MENNMQYYVTYRFYDTKGRRLAIFAVPDNILTSATKLRVLVIACSKKDTFSKNRAKQLFEEFITLKGMGFDATIAHPTEIMIDVRDDKPKFTFLKWCEANYFKYIPTIFALEAPLLYRGNELLDGRFPRFDIIPIEDADALPQTTSEN